MENIEEIDLMTMEIKDNMLSIELVTDEYDNETVAGCDPNCRPNCAPVCNPRCSPNCKPCYPYGKCDPKLFG